MRRCAGPDFRCERDFPPPPMTPEEAAHAIADFYNALKRRAAELGLD